ncbi:MAG: nucleotide-binding protein [Phycisphaeraceae bacterium]|nr:nucleotide-binding protein [Phycisphaeraceae bacterium]
MAKIDPKLFAAIESKTGLSKPQVYKRIQQITQSDYLPRHLAAIKLGAEVGIAINKYAKPEELGQLRQTGSPVAPPQAGNGVPAAPKAANAKGGKVATRKAVKATKNQVFVVHGRDGIAKAAVFDFLRAVGVTPIEWSQAIRMTNKPSPYIGEILDAAFSKVRAVVVLLTPDDVAQLRDDLLGRSEPAYEKRLTGQARPNVLFEAGMAFASHPDKTVLIQLGNIRPFSDIAGRHVLRMTDDAKQRKEFADRLEFAGCDVDTSGTDWFSAGNFTDPDTRVPARPKVKKKAKK